MGQVLYYPEAAAAIQKALHRVFDARSVAREWLERMGVPARYVPRLLVGKHVPDDSEETLAEFCRVIYEGWRKSAV